MTRILIIGGGGHSRVVMDAVERGRQWKAGGVVDPAFVVGTKVQGVRVLGSDRALARLRRQGLRFCIIAVGGAADTSLRPRLARKIEALGFDFATVVHPAAMVSPHAFLSEGAFIGAGAVVNPGARIGRHAIVNTAAVVEHDCRLGEFSHVAPGAVLGGAVAVGKNALVGAGSAVRPGITIGDNAVIGAGSAVVADVAAGVVAYGNPCRVARQA